MAQEPNDHDPEAGLDDDEPDELEDEFDDEFEDDEDDEDDDEDDDPELEEILSEDELGALYVKHRFFAEIDFNLTVGVLEDDAKGDPCISPGWWDITDEMGKKKPTIWICPQAAQRLMERAEAAQITTEQALGWMLNRAYGRGRR